MKEEPMEAEALFEAWLDGSLDGEEARAFERRLREESQLARLLELQQRIDGRLRERFAVPEPPLSELGPFEPASAERLGGARGGSSSLAGPRSTGPLGRAVTLLAAAAVLILVVEFGRRAAREPVAEPSREVAKLDADVPRGAERTLEKLGPVGPLEELDPGQAYAEPLEPDLSAVYAEATVCGDSWVAACDVVDDLGATLAAQYGEDLRLRNESARLFNGPFASSEWPTGTVLTGYLDEEPVVLVAERDDTMRCCVRVVEPPPESGLNVFSWSVGEVFLTEITPHSEPRFIDSFE